MGVLRFVRGIKDLFQRRQDVDSDQRISCRNVEASSEVSLHPYQDTRDRLLFVYRISISRCKSAEMNRNHGTTESNLVKRRIPVFSFSPDKAIDQPRAFKGPFQVLQAGPSISCHITILIIRNEIHRFSYPRFVRGPMFPQAPTLCIREGTVFALLMM